MDFRRIIEGNVRVMWISYVTKAIVDFRLDACLGRGDGAGGEVNIWDTVLSIR